MSSSQTFLSSLSDPSSKQKEQSVEKDSPDRNSIVFRIRQTPPPWLRAAKLLMRIGGALLIVAVILCVTVVSEKLAPAFSKRPANPPSALH